MFKMIRKMRNSFFKKNSLAVTDAFQMKGIQLLNDNFVDAVHKDSVANGMLASFALTDEYRFKIKQFSHALGMLDDTGICVLSDFLEDSDLDMIKNTIESLIQSEAKESCENVVFQNGLQGKYTSARELVNSNKTVVMKRLGQDNGMIDIFNLELFPQLSSVLKARVIDNDVVRSFCQKYELKVSNINAYYNESVSKTRGFHVDGWKPQFKMLIYLSDVLAPEYGPYCYIPKSHDDKTAKLINQSTFKNYPTETPIFNVNSAKLVLGKAGSGILSDQVGFHRGFPQSDRCSRYVLMINFRSAADI